MENTLVIIKPDGVKRNLVGNIMERFENKGLTILQLKMTRLDQKAVEEHYAHISHLSVWGDIISFMISGPVVIMVLEGHNAVAEVRRLMGTTFDAAAGTIRGDLALNGTIGDNLIHASDSVENAQLEIERFSSYLR